nr:hypothetical protein [Tanacetum cinerariifolium]
MLESSIVRDHDMGESSIVLDHDMGESSIVRDDLVDNQIVVLPEHLQNHALFLLKHDALRGSEERYCSLNRDDSNEFQPTPNGTPYWVPDVLEDEKPKEGLLFVSYNDAYETYLKKRKRHSHTRAHRLKAALVGGYDKVRGTSTDYCNFKRCVNSFIGYRDAQMLVDKMCKRKYGYKFVPFTGIDHNQRCVTFDAALLSDGTTKSFSWMLEAFLKTHKKQPPFAVTNQDDALRNAVDKGIGKGKHVVVDDEDEGDTDDLDDEALVATEEEFDEDDEIDDEFPTDEQ